MSILISRETKVVVYGIGGKYGSNQTTIMLKYGTHILAGIAPGRGGQSIQGVPLCDTLKEVLENHEVDTAIMYVPSIAVKECAFEVIEANLRLMMIAAEGVPLHDTMIIKSRAEEKGTWMLGPNTIGIIAPDECLIGSLASDYATKGSVGIVARGGTGTIEIIRMLSEAGIGQSTCVGAGGDKVIGKNPIDYLKLFEKDEQTKAIVLMGEIGGQKENECAGFIQQSKKPVYFYLLGRTAPPDTRMGHIGAIIAKESESFEAKRAIAAKAGAILVDTPWELVKMLQKAGLSKHGHSLIGV